MAIISVIVPVYNAEKWLVRCIESILAQTFTDFELILVDDGSPDHCGSICDEYGARDSRVCVIHKENEGVSAARNDGVAAAHGEFIAFIDADDWVEPQYLEVLYKNYSNSDVTMMKCVRTRGDIEREQSAESAPRIYSGKQAIKVLAEEVLSCPDYLCSVWAKLVRKELVLAHMFPKGQCMGEDIAVAYKWIWESNQVTILNYDLYNYYMNEWGG